MNANPKRDEFPITGIEGIDGNVSIIKVLTKPFIVWWKLVRKLV